MNDVERQWSELKAVRKMITQLDDMKKVGNTYQVTFELYNHGDIVLRVEHDLLRTLLLEREKWLVERLRDQRAAILRLADELGDLETS